jgi:putative endonuclease
VCGKVELDLVAVTPDENELVFVEVKTRSQDFSGHPSAAVSDLKLRNMRQAARLYLSEQHWSKDYRFDVITVLPGNNIEHFENVTL